MGFFLLSVKIRLGGTDRPFGHSRTISTQEQKREKEQREMMRAVVAEGGRCVLSSLPKPVVGDGQCLVKVFATSVNRADTLQRKGE